MKRLLRRLTAFVLVLALIATSSPLALADQMQPVAGDLRHLTFTATSGLWARFISPAPNSAVSAPAVTVEVATGLDQGAEVRINDLVVPVTSLGKRVVDGPAGMTRYTFYGVALQPGANRLTVIPLGAGSLRGRPVEETIFGAGDPVVLQGSVEGNAVADGRSVLNFSVIALDALRHPARLGALVKLSVVDGDASFIVKGETASSLTPALELTLGTGGTLSARLAAGLRPGPVTIHMRCGDVSAEQGFFLAPYVRAPLVVGLASIGVGSVPSAPGEDPSVADGANSRRGRAALFATGDIGSQTLLTLAYDTADVLDRTTGYGAFAQSDALANRPYEIVGDASITRDDALSSDHLYLRLDRKQSSAVWGEFQAQTGVNGGDGFNLLVDGAKIDLSNASGSGKLMLFNAHNTIAYARQSFNPLGLSTTGSLLHPDIVVGSDTVTLVSLDRAVGSVVQQTPLQRNVDYTLDYNTGELRFVNIPMPYDKNFNPQQIVVQYEYDGADVAAETSGARLEAGTRKLHFGVGYANDSYGTGNFSLLSENLSGALRGGGWSIEHLSSLGAAPGDQVNQTLGAGSGGGALRSSFNLSGAQDTFNASFDSTGQGFNNPFGGLSAPGLLDYQATYTHLLRGNRGQAVLAYNHQSDSASGTLNERSQGSLQLQRKLTKRFSLTAGLQTTTQSAQLSLAPSPSPSGQGAESSQESSLQGSLGFDWHFLPTVDINASRLSNLGASSVLSQPGETDAELGIDFPRKGRAYIREIWSDAPIQSFASSTLALTNPVSGTHSTTIGFERSLGADTTVNSEYDIQQTPDGNAITSSVGVQEKFQISKNLSGDANAQRGVGIGNGSGGFNAYGANLNYSGPRLRANGSYQLRTGSTSGSSLHLAASGAISPDISLIALLNDSSAAGLVSDEERMGLAYRPSGNDRAVSLLQYTLENSTSATIGTHGATISLDQALHPNDRLELGARYAYKLNGDTYYPAQSELFGLRIDQRIGARFDLGSEVRYLDVRHIPGASAMGFAVESGMRLGNEMRLAFGYNFSGAPDPQLAAAPARRGVYVTLTNVIDHILGWGR